MGSSLEDLLAFPITVRKAVGYQLHKIQYGIEPDDWKPFSEIGAGVNEIRIRDNNGIYRVMYVAKFEEALYVLHSFQKQMQQTSQHDKNIARTRYNRLVQQRRNSL
ncbi:type II toxin-antitoxin system RelE/ParE family toxin [Salmonella enterica]|uniref:Type II toxin-antitoxin system RelE/ParE family toxin n=1 Tax=Salmonella enterica TaxID=28901 RepID=A0A8E9X9U3_SALER|nr:type II toxin-antitoxin system RelE/ParE family toxin [Salmonella enterica]EEC5471726.1 type II toxin-antitoxin system RelE/ParE family toxin [Salmonella enterica subsp. enterica]EEG1639805.1 type II toxin-antitoxin system RelE/ParE family toxin [Salmonella enterica subsp. enterica serovar Irumu]EEO9885878.1 type II toxin-antitoxin system RelE/ParE family toxin [Salmonella enterica subsp. enterica serovar Derby]EGJ7160843.1 type II toxin-antitoxin system RelE/ParE family toxin [Salmonella en